MDIIRWSSDGHHYGYQMAISRTHHIFIRSSSHLHYTAGCARCSEAHVPYALRIGECSCPAAKLRAAVVKHSDTTDAPSSDAGPPITTTTRTAPHNNTACGIHLVQIRTRRAAMGMAATLAACPSRRSSRALWAACALRHPYVNAILAQASVLECVATAGVVVATMSWRPQLLLRHAQRAAAASKNVRPGRRGSKRRHQLATSPAGWATPPAQLAGCRPVRGLDPTPAIYATGEASPIR